MSGDDYEIGYGKPPRQHQFKKGTSGNPVALLADALLDLTQRGEIVLDPFLGSGSTLIAAEQTGRRCFGIELDPRYVDLILTRYERMTGKRTTSKENASPIIWTMP